MPDIVYAKKAEVDLEDAILIVRILHSSVNYKKILV